MSNQSAIYGWGVAVPRRRLPNEATQAAWNRSKLPGCRRIAGSDEDAVTFGVQAGLQAIEDSGLDRAQIDVLIFASLTAPFTERSCGTLIAEVLGLRSDVLCLDFSASLRAGTMALAMADNSICEKRAPYALVVAADTRLPRPGDPEECLYGHGGAALLLGPTKENSRAKILHKVQWQNAQADVWKTPDKKFPQSGDLRFSRLGAYATSMKAALKSILQATSWSPSNIDRVVVYSPDAKSGAGHLKKSGFDLRSQYCDLVSPKMGLIGTPHSLLMLVAALERSKPGEHLILQGYGDGADAFGH